MHTTITELDARVDEGSTEEELIDGGTVATPVREAVAIIPLTNVSTLLATDGVATIIVPETKWEADKTMEVTLTEMEDINVEVDTINDKVVVLTLVRHKMINYFYIVSLSGT